MDAAIMIIDPRQILEIRSIIPPPDERVKRIHPPPFSLPGRRDLETIPARSYEPGT
jgi:hypothetical protein